MALPAAPDGRSLVLTAWTDAPQAVIFDATTMEIIDRLSAGDPEKKKYYIRLFLDTLEPELGNLRAADISADQEPIPGDPSQTEEPGPDHRSGRCARHDERPRADHQGRRSHFPRPNWTRPVTYFLP